MAEKFQEKFGDRARSFGLGELQGLTGLSIKRLKASLRRLEAAGLLVWSEAAIGFPASPEGVPFAEDMPEVQYWRWPS